MVIIYVIYLYHKQALFTIVHTSVQMHPGSRNYNNQQFNHQSDLIFIVGLPSSSLLSSWQVNHFRKFSAAAMSGSIWKKIYLILRIKVLATRFTSTTERELAARIMSSFASIILALAMAATGFNFSVQ